MTEIKDYDSVVIGAGSAGITMAVGLAGLSKKVLLVSETVGGDCTHTGCVPSKRFLYKANQYVQTHEKAERQTIRETIFEDIRSTIQRIETHDRKALEHPCIAFVQGRAEFESKRQVKITPANGPEYFVTFGTCYIATGSSPLVIPVQDLPAEKCITSDTIFELKKLPETICIIGGGPIGAEMATAFAKFGVQVDLVIRSQLLPNDYPKAVEPVREQLHKLGVTIHEGVSEMKFQRDRDQLVLVMQDEQKQVTVNGSAYYVFALGRTPNTQLGLERAGISYDKHGIQVSSQLRTSNSRVYALGDVTTYPKFTHVAYQHARTVIAGRILPFGSSFNTPIPAITYTDPPVATVGSVEETDRVSIFELDLSQTDRGLIEESNQGKCFVAVDMITGTVKGASIVGRNAEGLILFYTVLVQQNISVFKLGSLISAYPTAANSINMLYSQFLKRYRNEFTFRIRSLLKRNSVRIITATFWLIGSVSLYLLLKSIDFNGERVTTILFDLLQSPWGILLYIALYSVRTLISFSAVVLTVLGGLVYGFWGGLALTLVASNLSSSVAYLLGKTVFASEATSPKGSFKHALQKNAFESVLIARFTFFPYDLLSYMCGALRIPFPAFILATAIGSIPGTIAFTSFGASISNISEVSAARLDSRFIVAGLGLMLISLAISYGIKKSKISAAAH
jgi:pyruvate/2-oxoglutarate dehydrogenase complex dihydrolipoamide dehydrogenase (E3) component/uncharacterized membrane protein YdjX (TVP38/TMEM64 family)